ncbi:MAG: hypothetical protein K2N44_18355 [Lachnospiraceae bacterium]|nr:hypothetical protein [Lachnospiraceae bacterium]
MFKKLIATLLITLLLCGSTSQSTWAAEMSPAPETSVLTEIFGTENVVPPGTDATANDGMPHGLILLTQSGKRDRWEPKYPDTNIQIYVIDPATGTQTLWSQFRANNPSVNTGYVCGGNALGQFNRDYTKCTAEYYNAGVSQRNNRVNHVGWIDQSGEFFDVNAALGLQNGGYPLGFYGPEDSFYFVTTEVKEGSDGKVYARNLVCKATEAEIRQGKYNIVRAAQPSELIIRQPNISYFLTKDILSGVIIYGHYGPEDWQIIGEMEIPLSGFADAGKNIAIVDYLPDFSFYRFFPGKEYISYLCDSTTGTIINYLPDSYTNDNKSEWGGVLSPDGATIAYLTVPGHSGTVSMEFVNISQFISSGFNPDMRGTPTKLELADGPVKQAKWNVFNYQTEDPSCILLEWRP